MTNLHPIEIKSLAAKGFVQGTAGIDGTTRPGEGHTVFARQMNPDGLGYRTVDVATGLDAESAVALKRAINYPD